ncbi:MAG: hypothetical protein Q9191_002888 [Dirinaria sp. TL-2023a]
MSDMCTSNAAPDTKPSEVEQQTLLKASDFAVQEYKAGAAPKPEGNLVDHGINLVANDWVSNVLLHESKGNIANNLLGIPREIRDLIYGCFFPRAKTIHLTDGSPIASAGSIEPATYTWSNDATKLMLSCRRIHDEVTSLIYRTNTFILTPWAMNYRYTRMAPHSNTDFWLSAMRPMMKSMVKKLHIYLAKPYLPQSISKIADGLAYFPEVEILIIPLSTILEPKRSNHRSSFEALCRAIEKSRADSRPIIWNDGGDLEVATMLANMPNGLMLRRPTALEKNSQKATDRRVYWDGW